MAIPAVVTAGEGRASREVYGESKVYLEIAGLPLVARVVSVLQSVPEVSEVYVVGNAERLESIFSEASFRAELSKPLHIVPQRRNLLENCWEGYRRALPGAGTDGREPREEDSQFEVLYVSGDLPLATPQEISEFIRLSQETGCDYAAGLVPEESLLPFRPQSPGDLGITVSTFNIRDGRLRQSNLHFAKPARFGNRYYVEEMYEHRYQRQFGNMLSLGWRLLTEERGGPTTLFFFLVIHIAGLADRIGLRWLSDLFRVIVSFERVERTLSWLLKTDFRFVVTEAGGCAVDIDKEPEYDALKAHFEEWYKAQRDVAERLYGPLPLPERTSPAAAPPSGSGNGEQE